MKIGYIGLNLPEGKVKYQDENLLALEKKDKPKKITPYFAEFAKEEFIHSDVIAVHENNILDLLIYDMEKVDGRTHCPEALKLQLGHDRDFCVWIFLPKNLQAGKAQNRVSDSLRSDHQYFFWKIFNH